MKTLKRNPDVNWRPEGHREARALEVLEDPERAGEDSEVNSLGTVTLLAGGVMYQLNFLGGEIWKLCDGSLDRSKMAIRLSETFDEDPAIIRRDLESFLDDMIRKGLIHEE